MIDNSVMYGLRNPAFTQDIGTTMVNQMFPVPSSYNPVIGGMPAMGGAGQLGQLNGDTFQNSGKKAKKGHFVRNFLIGAGIITAGLLGLRHFGKIKPLNEYFGKLFKGHSGTGFFERIRNRFKK